MLIDNNSIIIICIIHQVSLLLKYYYVDIYIMLLFIVSADINDKVTEQLQKLKSDGTLKDWRAKVLGGGRIAHDATSKTIKVYGYSQVILL